MRAFVATCVLVACSPPPRPKPPERDAPDDKPAAPRPAGRNFPPPPAGFATADVVVLSAGTLTSYALANDKLQATGSVKLFEVAEGDEGESRMMGLGRGDFADRDHLFITIGRRDVVMVTATGITEVPVPSEDNFKTPKPTPQADAGDTSGTGYQPNTGLVITPTSAWWVACPWGLAADGFQCDEYVSAQLWPTAKLQRNKAPIESRAFAWTDTLAGYTLKRDPKAVTCEHGQTSVKLAADVDPDEQIHDAHWVSTNPPRLLVVYGHPGYASLVPDRWTLHAGCAQQSVATGSWAAPGPAGWWIGHSFAKTEPDHELYRGDKVIAAFPWHARVWLRPTP
jgi:hypothetical protein